MTAFALGFLFGCVLLQQQAQLPPAGPLFVLALGVAGLLVWLRSKSTPGWVILAGVWVLGLLGGGAFGALRAEERLQHFWRVEDEGRDFSVTGVLSELPTPTTHGARFTLSVEQWHLADRVPPSAQTLALSWYGAVPQPGLKAGDRWRLTLRLKRPHATQNPNLPDMEAWWLEHGVDATGYVKTGRNLAPPIHLGEAKGFFPSLNRVRERVRSRMRQTLGHSPEADVLVALAIGDQRGIDRPHWDLFQRTGVAHLMSISGLHVTMIGAMGRLLMAWLWRRSSKGCLIYPAPMAASWAAFVFALGYALLAGFGVPAQRTALMVGVAALSSVWATRISVWTVLAWACFLVLLLDPWAPLAPGFWLSFVAVGLLMLSMPSGVCELSDLRQETPSWRRALVDATRAQWVVTLGLAPLGAWLFAQFSLVSPLANAVAIPVVSYVVTPLSLLGAITSALGLDTPLSMAAWVQSGVHQGLRWVDGPYASMSWPTPHWVVLAAASLGLILLLWPRRSLRVRVCGGVLTLPFLWLPIQQHLLGLNADAPAPGALKVWFLDVGQGSAVVVQTEKHSLVYDTGPGFSGGDSGSRIVVPMMRSMGFARLDGLVISHEDVDHAGGAISVMNALKPSWISSSVPLTFSDEEAKIERTETALNLVHAFRASKMHQDCAAVEPWVWDGVTFSFLHPDGSGQHLESNARSCVLEIRVGGRVLWLTGDIPAAVERQLLDRDPGGLPTVDVLLAPHHGSKTSSSELFIQTLAPKHVVIQVGYRSRFGHPHRVVLDRYQALGAKIWRTDHHGALRFDVSTTGELAVESERIERRRYWHQIFQPEP